MNETSHHHCQETNSMFIVLGGFLSFIGGFGVGASMVVQRYALLFDPAALVPFACGRRWPRMRVWAIGMMWYQISNAFLAASTVIAPLSLCTAMFTLLLMWNAVIAYKYLDERTSPCQIIGSVTIIVGCILSVVGVPKNMCNDYTLDHIEGLVYQPFGAVYIGSLLTCAIGLTLLSLVFETRYPLHKRPVPPRIHRVMSVVEPVSLGMQEGLTQMSAKIIFSVLFHDVIHDVGAGLSRFWLWPWVVILTLVGVGTIFWIKRIYARYKTTTALPFEYGTVHMAQTLGGFLFFREIWVMNLEETIICLLGLFLVVAGIALTGISSDTTRSHLVKVESCTRKRSEGSDMVTSAIMIIRKVIGALLSVYFNRAFYIPDELSV